jgi:hypothetical protein
VAGFLSFDQVKERLRTRLGVEDFAVDSTWGQIVADATNNAASGIMGVLLGRGFTQEQIRSWDSLSEFHGDIALFWALVNGGVARDYDDRLINKLDRRAELATVDVMIGGKLVQPGASAGGGGVRNGTLSNDNDLFPAARRCSPFLSGWWR